jgi:hypothetical protein
MTARIVIVGGPRHGTGTGCWRSWAPATGERIGGMPMVAGQGGTPCRVRLPGRPGSTSTTARRQACRSGQTFRSRA